MAGRRGQGRGSQTAHGRGLRGKGGPASSSVVPTWLPEGTPGVVSSISSLPKQLSEQLLGEVNWTSRDDRRFSQPLNRVSPAILQDCGEGPGAKETDLMAKTLWNLPAGGAVVMTPRRTPLFPLPRGYLTPGPWGLRM